MIITFTYHNSKTYHTSIIRSSPLGKKPTSLSMRTINLPKPQHRSPCPLSPPLNRNNPLPVNRSTSNEDRQQEESKTPQTHLDPLPVPPLLPSVTAPRSHLLTPHFTPLLGVHLLISPSQDQDQGPTAAVAAAPITQSQPQ